MNKSDFFDDRIVAFDVSKHPHPHPHPHTHPHADPELEPLSLRVVYYEWSDEQNKWLKTREADPEPDQSMPSGDFDGQIKEVEL